MRTFAVIGAGNGGKAVAADLTLQGRAVRLFEFSEFSANFGSLKDDRTLRASGAITGEAVLQTVTTDFAEAVHGADVIMVCTQALAHARTARELARLVKPEQLVVLNPGSTGGALQFAHVFRQQGLRELPTLVEFSTLTYGCRASGACVAVKVKVDRVLYGALPAEALDSVGPGLETLFPGLVRGATVLEAGLNNANPVIHPPITLLNAARFENQGTEVYFYRDGVSPAVARLIRLLDEERMALLKALGYPAQPDPVTSVQQGYADSTDYFECYAHGPGFIDFRAPNTLDHRYFHEDMGMGLVMFCSLGELLDVPTPTCQAVVRLGAIIAGRDYFAEGARTLDSLGLAGLDKDGLARYLSTGCLSG